VLVVTHAEEKRRSFKGFDFKTILLLLLVQIINFK